MSYVIYDPETSRRLSEHVSDLAAYIAADSAATRLRRSVVVYRLAPDDSIMSGQEGVWVDPVASGE